MAQLKKLMQQIKNTKKNAVNDISSQLTGLYNNLDTEDRGSLFADKALEVLQKVKMKEINFKMVKRKK